MIKGLRGIHHTAISVPSLAAAEEFYCNRLGLRKVLRWDVEASEAIDQIVGLKNTVAKTLMVDAGNTFLEIFEFSSPAARGQDNRPVCDHGFTHIAFDVDPKEIENVYHALEAAGVQWHCELTGSPEGDGTARMTYGRDPFGNVIEIQALRTDADFHINKLSGWSTN